jgi:hypothetical protein
MDSDPLSLEQALGPQILTPAASVSALRRFVRPRTKRERCELCAIELPPKHQHLFSSADRQIACACGACALLFSASGAKRYSLIPRDGEYWPRFKMNDADWLALNIPINLAFITRSSVANEVLAFYPSPAGATESHLPPEAWNQLLADNPRLAELKPDVEALLIYRVGDVRKYFRAPIDECYKLVGLIRSTWRGLSGGVEVWRAIAEYFRDLQKQSREVAET